MSESDLLVNTILPTRGSAKKASQNISEQLLSSPIRSDEDVLSSSPIFGQPARAKGSVKFRYGSKAKHRDSPTTSSPSKSPIFSKPRHTHSIAPPQAPVHRGRKRQLSIPENRMPREASSSSLTSLTSSASSAPSSPSIRPKKAVRPVQEIPTAPSTPRGPVSQLRRAQISRTDRVGHDDAKNIFSSYPAGSCAHDEDWSIKTLGTFVWVLVSKEGNLFHDEEGDELKGGIWWPARIMSPSFNTTSLRVTLYGQISSGVEKVLEIDSPSSHNILPMLSRQRALRFTWSTSQLDVDSSDVRVSPKKKQKTGMGFKWQAAVNDMLDDEQKENDDLPNMLSFYGERISTPETGGSKKSSRRQCRDKANDATRRNEFQSEDARWSPPPCDPTLQVPGELVLARGPRDKKYYWPAMITAYVAPKAPKHPPRYTLKFLDDTTHDVTRDRFYIGSEPGFTSCDIGYFESSVKDVDDEDEVDDIDFVSHNARPLSSPLPQLPLTSNFNDLTMHEQMAYVKPVLSAILSDTYGPVRERHRKFMQGGLARASVQEGAAVRGSLSPKEVQILHDHLCNWVLRDERRAQLHLNDDVEAGISSGLTQFVHDRICTVDVTAVELSPEMEAPPSSFTSHNTSMASELESLSSPVRPEVEDKVCGATPTAEHQEYDPSISSHEKSSSAEGALVVPPTDLVDGPPRQRGCEAYEALSPVEKLAYCSNILLPEAVQQILLWRSGERSSLDLLSPEDEQTLHDIGERQADETDWVFDILRLRDAQLRTLRKNIPIVPPAEVATGGGTRSRPKKVNNRRP